MPILLTFSNNLYRHDNAPHDRWQHVTTFPKHFHDGSENNVVESHISDEPGHAIREFLTFVRQRLISTAPRSSYR